MLVRAPGHTAILGAPPGPCSQREDHLAASRVDTH